MATPDLHPDLAAAAQHLHEDHAAFDARFDDLCERARCGDWRVVDEVWDGFVDDIEAHLEFEEDMVFPRLRGTGPAGAALAERLIGQHGEIRRLLAELGVQIQLHRADESIIVALVAGLREHATIESELLYPWLREEAARVA